MELSGEIGEMINILKKIYRISHNVKGTTETPSKLRGMLAAELADVVICLDLLCVTTTPCIPVLHPAHFPMLNKDMAVVANRVAVVLGDLIHGIEFMRNGALPQRSQVQFDRSAQKIVVFMMWIAKQNRIDLPIAVVNKFDITTDKHGLSTYFVPEEMTDCL
jgi:hypothetical protein